MKFPVGSVSGKNAGALEGGVLDETPRDVKEEVLVDGAIGCSARIKVMDTPTTDLPAVFDQGYVPPFSPMCLSHSHEWLCAPRMKMV